MPSDTIHRAIEDAQLRYDLFPSPGPEAASTPVIVGVSGGADSVCLLHALHHLAHRWNLTVHAAHLDHGLRPDSGEDARFVAELAASWGIPFHTRRVSAQDLTDSRENLEAAARRLRYRFLAEVAYDVSRKAGGPTPPTVAVAHTADDQAETVVMHFLRGSGLRGLAGMYPVTQMTPAGTNQPVRVVRPLLYASRADILRYLDKHGLPWREDPSNQDQRFTRNRLRHDLLPHMRAYNPNLIATLGRTATVLQGEVERAEQQDQAAFERIHLAETFTPEEALVRVVLDLDAFRRLDVATQRGVLRLAGSRLHLDDEFTFDLIENLRLQLLAAEGAGGPFTLISGYVWTVAPPRFSIHQKEALPFLPNHPYLTRRWRALYTAVTAPVDDILDVNGWRLRCTQLSVQDLPPDWQQQSDPWQVYLDLHQVGELLLTTPRKGQRFAPLGMHGQRKNLGDFFTDQKVPAKLRSGWPLLIDGASTEVVWVCGLRLAHHVRITPATTRVLHLQWERRNGNAE